MNNRCGNGTGSFEVEIGADTTKFTNVIITRLKRERWYLVRESEMTIEDQTKIRSWISGNTVVISEQLWILRVVVVVAFKWFLNTLGVFKCIHVVVLCISLYKMLVFYCTFSSSLLEPVDHLLFSKCRNGTEWITEDVAYAFRHSNI